MARYTVEDRGQIEAERKRRRKKAKREPNESEVVDHLWRQAKAVAMPPGPWRPEYRREFLAAKKSVKRARQEERQQELATRTRHRTGRELAAERQRAYTRERPGMPASILRTPEAEHWQATHRDPGSWGGALLDAMELFGKTGELLVDFGTGIPTLIRDPSILNASIVGVSFIPGAGKVFRVLKGAGHGLALAEQGVRVAKAPRALRGPRRTLRYGEGEIGTRTSPSVFTAAAERGYDVASSRITPAVERALESENKLVRAAGHAALPLSMRARVPKRMGVVHARQTHRAVSEYSTEIAVLRANPHVVGKRPRGYAAAHWWWAQLDDSLHNQQGLNLLKDRFQGLKERVMDGTVARELQDDLVKVEDQIRAGREAGADYFGELRPLYDAKGSILRQLQDMPLLTRDLDEIIQEFGQMGKVTVDSGTIEAIRSLMSSRERLMGLTDEVPAAAVAGEPVAKALAPGVLVRAADRSNIGRILEMDGDHALVHFVNRAEGTEATVRLSLGLLSPAVRAARGTLFETVAGTRRGLMMDWLGLEPTGREIFAGHRLKAKAKEVGFSPGVSTGRVQLPKGLAHKNERILLETGRVRRDLEVFIEDWQDANRYYFVTKAQDDLSSMGKRVDPNVGPEDNVILINPRAEPTPQAWRVPRERQAELGGFNEPIVTDINTVFAETPEQMREMLSLAEHAGTLSDIRQVPKDVFDAYVSRAVRGTAFYTNPQTRKVLGGLGKGLSSVNDLLYASIIYTQPGYIPANLFGNLLMAAADQLALLPINLFQAGQILMGSNKRLKRMLLGEVGHGATVALAQTKLLKKPAHVIGGIPDNWPRVAAWVHHAKMNGVIPYWKPWLTKNDLTKLERYVRDRATNREVLDEITESATESMVRFDLMSPAEQAIVPKIMFVWPWIRGAARYPIRFALDHPIRSGLAAYIAYNQGLPLTETVLPYGNRNVEGLPDRPPWLQDAIRWGSDVINGRAFPKVLNVGPISPLSTARQLVGSAIGEPGYQTFMEMVNPGIRAGVNIARRETPYGAAGSYREAALSNAQTLAPNFGLIQDLANPPGPGGLYPGDQSRLGRLERALRVIPYAVDPKVAREQAIRRGVIEKPPEFSTERKLAQWAKDHPEQFDQAYTPYIVKYREIADRVRAGKDALAKAEGLSGRSKLSQRQEAAVELNVLLEARPDLFEGVDPEQLHAQRRQVFERGLSKDIRDYMDALRGLLEFEDVLGARIRTIVRNAQEYLKDRAKATRLASG